MLNANMNNIILSSALSETLKKQNNQPDLKPNGEPYKRYYPPPAYIYSSYQYQDVGADMRYRTEITKFFQQKVLKWIQSYKEFSHLKKHYDFINSKQGLVYIYNLLKLFCKKSNINWFDLRDNYNVVKDFLRFKIGNV